MFTSDNVMMTLLAACRSVEIIVSVHPVNDCILVDLNRRIFPAFIHMQRASWFGKKTFQQLTHQVLCTLVKSFVRAACERVSASAKNPSPVKKAYICEDVAKKLERAKNCLAKSDVDEVRERMRDGSLDENAKRCDERNIGAAQYKSGNCARASERFVERCALIFVAFH